MALIKCPECGHDISSKAKVCIHCGYPIEELSDSNENEVKTEIEFEDSKIIPKENHALSEEELNKLLDCSVFLYKKKSKAKQMFLDIRREKNAGWLVNGPDLVSLQLKEAFEDVKDFIKEHELNALLEEEIFLDVEIEHLAVLKKILLFEYENTRDRLTAIAKQKADYAYNKVASEYNGMGFGILSSSIIDHLLYIAMDTSEKMKAEKRAEEAAKKVMEEADVMKTAANITEQNCYIPFEKEAIAMIEAFYKNIENRIYASNRAEYNIEDVQKKVESKIDAFKKRVPDWEDRMASIRTIDDVTIRINENMKIGEEGYCKGYVAAGVIYDRYNDLESAYDCYKKAILMDPLDRLALNNLGYFHSHIETKYFDAELAIRYLSRSDLPVAYHNLASIYNPQLKNDGFEKYKDADKAMRLYKLALSKGYNSSTTYNNIGSLYAGSKGDVLRAAVYCHIAAVMGNSMGVSNFNKYTEHVAKKYGKRTVEQIKTLKSLEEGEQFISKVLSRKFKWF